MIKSMTGYGKGTIAISDKNIVVELRTLNSRTLDVGLRLPGEYRDMELEIRALIAEHIVRGKVECYLTIENDASTGGHLVQRELALHYFNELKELATITGMPLGPEVLPAILRLPDVIGQSSKIISDAQKQAILEAARTAIGSLDAYRIHEGEILEKDFFLRINTILALLREAEAFENQRITKIRNRLRADIAQIEARVKVDENRFEQELIYYLEKIDFTEEKIRLHKHCDHFLQIMKENESQGRKLGFVAQEIGREINTLGSKANDSDIQQLVVQMKDELEKIKEQLLNIL